jgi:uncharacterized protein YciI
MNRFNALIVWPISLAMVVSLCSCAGADRRVRADLGPGSQVFVFSYLLLDEPEQLPKDELSAVVKGHRSNIEQLSEAGTLLIAGPLFEPVIGEGYSGLFVFDVRTIEDGLRLFNTDPAVQAKVFKPEMYLFESADPLAELTRLKREEKEARLADPDIPDAWEGRAYVLAVASPRSTFDAHNKAVLVNGLMTLEGTDTPNQRLLFLDFETVDQARNGFAASNLDDWSFYGWYGSKTVGALRALQRND